MTVEMWLTIGLIASLVLNTLQGAKANDWRAKLKRAVELIDHLTAPTDDGQDVHVFDPTDRSETRQEQDDWLATHRGVQPKPGYERKAR